MFAFLPQANTNDRPYVITGDDVTQCFDHVSTVYKRKKLQIRKCEFLSTWVRFVNKPFNIIDLTS